MNREHPDRDAASQEHPSAPDVLEQLVAECLEHRRLRDEAGIDRVCREHPELADAIRRRLKLLSELGLSDGTAEPYPERLGGFRLIRRLGVGGMGVVFLAEQEALHRQVALKLIRSELSFVPGARDRFLREVETVAQLKHPGIVPIYTVGDEQGVPFFAMEYIEGCSLAEVLQQLPDGAAANLRGEDLGRLLAVPGSEPASVPGNFCGSWVEVCLRLMHHVATALDHAHTRGVLHRDIKPSNIMLTHDGRALLVDFGLASIEGNSKLTRTGSQVGSLPYMPPERFADQPVDRRSDVYSLGVTLYEMLTLRPPYWSTSSARMIQLILKGLPDRIQRHNTAVPWDAETVCLTAMERDADRRYASAADFASDLLNVLELRPIAARRAGPGLRVKRWVQRHPARSLGLVLAFVLLVLGPLVFAVQERFKRESLRQANEEISRKATLAQQNAAVAEQRAQDLLRLSDVKRLEDLKRAAERLWPRRPDKVAAYRSWLEQAHALQGRLDQHLVTLEVIGRRAVSTTAEGRRQFASEEDGWWYAALETLTHDIEALGDPEHGLIRDIEKRLDVALAIERETITEPMDDWEFTRQEVAQSSAYAGLVLEPQMGLVPLEPDPSSGRFEFWLWESGTRPEREEQTSRYHITGDTGMVFILLPAGTFMMGAQNNARTPTYDAEAQPIEGPPHQVTLDPFFISKYEMTQGQWLRLMGENRSDNKSDNGEGDPLAHPVVLVNYDECVLATSRLGLRLPTEAQWEYAARGGTSTPRWFGNDKTRLRETDNIADHQHLVAGTNPEIFIHETWDDGFWHHAPVGSYLPNPFGLHDVLGNVWEWCRDAYGGYRAPVAPGDGERIVSGVRLRMIRGGCWEFCAAVARSSWRLEYDPSFSLDALGLRLAKHLDR